MNQSINNLEAWINNNGVGPLIKCLPLIPNKRKCLFEEIKHYINSNNELKRRIIIDDKFDDFDNLEGLNQAIKETENNEGNKL